MNRQQQALAQLQVDNAKSERATAMDAIIAAKSPAEADSAARDAASAAHRLQRAEQALHQD